MEIKGKIILALPEVTGVAKATGNPWKKREYVLETSETYPKKVHFDFFGDRADQYPLSVGDEVTLSFDIESREYQAGGIRAFVDGKPRKPHSNPATLQSTCRFLQCPIPRLWRLTPTAIFRSDIVNIQKGTSATICGCKPLSCFMIKVISKSIIDHEINIITAYSDYCRHCGTMLSHGAGTTSQSSSR